MKILHIQGRYYPFGGAETYFRDLSKMQIEAGHEVSLVYASEIPDNLLRESWIHAFEGSWGIRTGISTKKRILKFIEEKAPDVVHMHVVHFAISPIVLKAICKRWPVVYTVHDILWLCIKSCIASRLKDSARILPNGTACDSRLGIDCILKGCLSSVLSNSTTESVKRIIITLWKLNALKHASNFIVNSRYVKKQLIRHSFYEERIQVIKPYLSLPNTWASINTKSALLHHDNIILFVGKTTKIKGVYDLIDAVTLIKNTNLKLMFVGDGEERQSLRSYAQLRQVSDRVMIEGHVKREDLISYYRNASIVVLPSRCPETFALVGLEAMYFGTPVIAYDVGAVREWLENARAGYLVKPGDINEFSCKIADILRKRHLQKELGKYGKAYAASFIDPERFMSEIVNSYEDAIETFASKQHKRSRRIQPA